MTRLTPSDYADTGQWRLLIKIFRTGMSAQLNNTLHEDVEPFVLFDTEWEADDDNILFKIEETVYSHPRVLDDFAAKIVLYEPNCLFIPSELIDDEEGNEEKYYTTLFPCEPCDIMTERDRDISVAYNPGKGVKSFLKRTFPGTRITSNLMDAVKAKRIRNTGKSLFIIERDKESDFILLDGKNLISASTHQTLNGSDTLYQAFNILRAYDIKIGDLKIEMEGDEKVSEVKKLLEIFAGKNS